MLWSRDIKQYLLLSAMEFSSWKLRYEASGIPELMDQSHRPNVCEHQMSPEIGVKIVELRSRDIFWEPRRLQNELARLAIESIPSLSGIYRCLKRTNLIESHGRKGRAKKFKRWERGGPMELWRMDVVGGILLADGKELKCLTGVNDHSLLCVMAGLLVRATSRSVCDHFANAMRIHGVPQELLTDNGKVFPSRFGYKDTEVLFDRICRENGIDPLLNAPCSPTTTGKIERFHRRLRTEFLQSCTFENQANAQAELDTWVIDYSNVRPH